MSATLVAGVLTGLSYGLLGLGVVLVYKTQRFISLAQSQLGVVAALVLAKLVLDFGWPYWVAFPVALTVGVAAGAASYFLVLRRLRRSSPMAATLASLGIAELLLALTFVKALAPNATVRYQNGYPVPFSVRFSVFGYVMHGQDVLIVTLVPALALGLALFFRDTSLGRAIRAVASNPEEAELCGISTARVGTTVWAIAGGLSAVTAVLQAPGQGTLHLATFGPTLLLRAFGAAAAGGFSSLTATMAGGLALGVLEHVTLHVTHSGGVSEVVLVVAIALLCSRRSAGALSRLTRRDSDTRHVVARHPRPTPRWRLPLAAAAGVALPLLPLFSTEASRFSLTLLVVFAIVSVSLTVLLGWAGQLSLGHFALVGMGAYLTARLEPHGWSMPALLLAAAALGATTLLLVSLPAARTRGATLPVMTLGLAVLAPSWLFRQSWFSVRPTVSVRVPSLAGLDHPGGQLPVYLSAVALLLLSVKALGRVHQSRPGRVLLAQRDNADAAALLGIGPLPTRVGIVAVSGGLAAMAGVLWASTWHAVSPDLLAPEWSIQILAAPIIGGLGSLSGAVVGTVVVFGPSLFFGSWFRSVFGNEVGVSLCLAGLGLIVTQLFFPGGISTLWLKPEPRRSTPGEPAPSGVKQKRRRPLRSRRSVPVRPPVLTTTDISLHFEGVAALDHVSIEVRQGEIVAVIGPNGAGKSSLLDVITGLTPPDNGRVVLLGADITDAATHLRAAAGLGRSFQRGSLFPALTVTETVMLGLSQTSPIRLIEALAGAPWVAHDDRALRDRALVIVGEYGLDPWADVPVAELSTGLRRVCDLALQVARSPRILLLDEPAAGLSSREAEALGPALDRIRTTLEIPVLLVEHDIALVRAVADRVYAMAAGRVIAQGSPAEVLVDQRVIAEYLGAPISVKAKR